MSDKNKEEEKNHKRKAFKLIDVEENMKKNIEKWGANRSRTIRPAVSTGLENRV